MPISRLTTHPQAEMPEMPDTQNSAGHRGTLVGEWAVWAREG